MADNKDTAYAGQSKTALGKVVQENPELVAPADRPDYNPDDYKDVPAPDPHVTPDTRRDQPVSVSGETEKKSSSPSSGSGSSGKRSSSSDKDK